MEVGRDVSVDQEAGRAVNDTTRSSCALSALVCRMPESRCEHGLESKQSLEESGADKTRLTFDWSGRWDWIWVPGAWGQRRLV